MERKVVRITIEQEKVKEIREAPDEDTAVTILATYVDEERDLAYQRGFTNAGGEDDEE